MLLFQISLKRVTHFIYLGHYIAEDLKHANMLARRFVRCTLEAKITLFRAHCTPQYEGAPVSQLYSKVTQGLAVRNILCFAMSLPCLHGTFTKEVSRANKQNSWQQLQLPEDHRRSECPIVRHLITRRP